MRRRQEEREAVGRAVADRQRFESPECQVRAIGVIRVMSRSQVAPASLILALRELHVPEVEIRGHGAAVELDGALEAADGCPG